MISTRDAVKLRGIQQHVDLKIHLFLWGRCGGAFQAWSVSETPAALTHRESRKQAIFFHWRPVKRQSMPGKWWMLRNTLPWAWIFHPDRNRWGQKISYKTLNKLWSQIRWQKYIRWAAFWPVKKMQPGLGQKAARSQAHAAKIDVYLSRKYRSTRPGSLIIYFSHYKSAACCRINSSLPVGCLIIPKGHCSAIRAGLYLTQTQLSQEILLLAVTGP